VSARLREAFEQELRTGAELAALGRAADAFTHFERAHILGQRRTFLHVRAHWAMLKAGLSRRDGREIVGQVPRLLAALLMSRIWVPAGNTGGADVSAFARMPVPDDLRALLDGRSDR
jgi:hypothetical protein